MALSRYFFLVSLVFLFLTPFYITESSFLTDNTINPNNDYFTPIEIRGNAEFDFYDFEGSGTSNDPFIIEGYNAESDWGFVVIENTDKYFIIQNNNFTGLNRAHNAIILDNVANGIIQNNSISNTVYASIYVGRGENIVIFNNTLFNSGDAGLRIDESTFVHVLENKVFNHNVGIIFNYGSNTNNIKNNTIYDIVTRGIFLLNSTDNHIEQNYVYDCRKGIYLSDSNFNSITANRIKNNSDTGIWILLSNENELWGNEIIRNKHIGLDVKGSNNYIWYNSFIDNNLAGNSQALNFGNNSFTRNYWNDWNGPDTNNDELVDNPYQIFGELYTFDLEPLVNKPDFKIGPPITVGTSFGIGEELQSNQDESSSAPIASFFDRNNLSYLFILFPIGIGLIYFITKKRTSKSLFIDLLTTKKSNILYQIFYKLTIGLENLNSSYVIEPVHLDLQTNIKTQNLINYFPEEYIFDLKEELKGRTILILVEMAYRYPNTTDQVNLYKLLKIPRSTFSTDIQKLTELNYIEPKLNILAFQDLRFKNYIITEKGIKFLRILREMLKISFRFELETSQ